MREMVSLYPPTHKGKLGPKYNQFVWYPAPRQGPEGANIAGVVMDMG